MQRTQKPEHHRTNNLILKLGCGSIEMAHGVEAYGLIPSIHNGHFKPIGSPSFGRHLPLCAGTYIDTHVHTHTHREYNESFRSRLWN